MMASRRRTVGGRPRPIMIVIIIAILIMFIGIAISMYAYLSPMEEEKAFFGESSYGSCSFCKGSDEEKIRDAKSENETKRNLRIVGPVLLGIGGVFLIGSCIFAASNGGLTSSMGRSGQHDMVHHGNRFPLQTNHKRPEMQQQGNVQYGGTTTHNPPAQYNTGHHQNSPYPPLLNNHQNPYPPPQVNQSHPPYFQTDPMAQQQQPLFNTQTNKPTIQQPAFNNDITFQQPAFNPHSSSLGGYKGKKLFFAKNLELFSVFSRTPFSQDILKNRNSRSVEIKGSQRFGQSLIFNQL